MFLRVALACLLCVPAAGFAQVYQYKDAQGRTVFSDTPPPGVSAVKKDVKAPPAGAERPRAQETLDAFQKRRDERLELEAKDAKTKAEREKAAANCEQARNRLAGLQSGQRMVRFNASGEREFLDDAARQQEISQTQKSIDEWCK